MLLRCLLIILIYIHKPLIEGKGIFGYFRRGDEGVSISSLGQSEGDQSVNYASKFYNIAKRTRLAVLADSKVVEETKGVLSRLHLIRIPKAYSSALSSVARRLVGCNPPGPCCKYPGDPVGSCPSKGLNICEDEKRVIGCTHHYPNLDYLYDKDVISISIMREPLNRSISAFFYPGMHHNSDCKLPLEECFKAYCTDNRWTNVAVKMLSGAMAYDAEDTCKTSCKRSLDTAKGNLLHLRLMGIAEMWELSILLLYVKTPLVLPLISELLLGSNSVNYIYGNSSSSSSSSSISSISSSSIKGNNYSNKDNPFRKGSKDKEYRDFKASVLSNPSLLSLLKHQNELDLQLYNAAIDLLCVNIHLTGLWKYPIVRKYWRERSPREVKKCTGN